MTIGPVGYEPLLEVHLDNIVVTSSLNDIRLLTAESCRVSIDLFLNACRWPLIKHSQVRGELPSPLKWNGERQWKFVASLRQPVIYILRDHINMFSDLGKDWVSGSSTDYYHFIPTIYAFELDLHHFEVNLYVNDQNIIDKPLVKDENGARILSYSKKLRADTIPAILTMQGPRLHHEAQIPANIYLPEATLIPFIVEAQHLSFALSLPRWNTRASKYANRMGRVGFCLMVASYRYYADVHEENIEQLRLDITVRLFAVMTAFFGC
jgi:hypothetical protein